MTSNTQIIEKLIDSFPNNVKDEIITEVSERLFKGLENGLDCNNIREYPAVYLFDREKKLETGPYTIEQIKIIALKKRENFPKMMGTDSEAIDEFDQIRHNSAIKTVITLDYIVDDVLMWHIISDVKSPHIYQHNTVNLE